MARRGWTWSEAAERAGLPRDACIHTLTGRSDDGLPALLSILGLDGAADDTPPPWWDEALAHKDEMSLAELAAKLGISVSTLTSELRARGVRRRVSAPTPPPALPPSRHPKRRSGSKDALIEQYLHLLGKVPDSEVARLAKVSVRTIASYRARNQIPGYGGPRRRPAPRGRRESKVDDFAEILGRVPDRVVAEIAGMSLGAVRNFRVKKGIRAAGRIPQSEIDARVAAFRQGHEAADPASAERPLALRANRGELKAWRCHVEDEDDPKVVIASSLAEAIAVASRALGGDDRIQRLERLGEVVASA